MPRSFSRILRRRKDPRIWMRAVLGVLLAANLTAAVIVFRPWGGSAEDLRRELAALRQQVAQRQTSVERLRALASKVETARKEADEFVANYFLDRRTVSSTILSELESLAKKAGIKQKERTFVFEPVEGSDTLSMMTINAGYEGTYSDLMHFVNLIDRSPRFLIVQDLQAAPQESGLTLNVTMKLNAFVRESDSRPPEAVQEAVMQ